MIATHGHPYESCQLEGTRWARDFVNIRTLPPSPALPHRVMREAVGFLPQRLAREFGAEVFIHVDLAASFFRVVATDFRKEFWHLDRLENVSDTIHWCALGGSFLADFAMDPSQARIFAWGLNPMPPAIRYALGELKGRDPDNIPTAACTRAGDLIQFVDHDQTNLSAASVIAYFNLGPVGMRVAANGRAPEHLFHDGFIQFILPGVESPYAHLVDRFLQLTGFPIMGITSGNFSSKGRYSARSGGTHKDLGEIQENMGFLGIPILAGPISGQGMEDSRLSMHERYRRLNAPFEVLSDDQRENAVDLLPTSVTIVRPDRSGQEWAVVRHGSLHHSMIQERMAGHGIRIRLETESRLRVSQY
ncbi:MAG: hypothetical protein U9R25_08070 [Chloroflexota bacterium]|nr:hypothetical protein [Chloroflexota bacterium]